MEETSTYVEQLRAVFDSCDVSSKGMLGKDELQMLCSKLQLDGQADRLIQHLLGRDGSSRVDFEEFKEGFVSLLAQSVQDLGLSEDEQTGRAEEETTPKLVYGNKCYGRRTRPMLSPLSSLSDDEKGGSSSLEPAINIQKSYQIDDNKPAPRKRQRVGSHGREGTAPWEGQQDGRVPPPGPLGEEDEGDVLHNIWQSLGVGQDGYLDEEELRKVCQHIGMENTSEQVITQLFDKLDVDRRGKISVSQFVRLLQTGSSPLNTQATHENQRNPSTSCLESQELRWFPDLDPDNTGYAQAEKVVALWESLDIPGGKHILRDVGFSTCGEISLLELSDILDEILQSSASALTSQVALATLRNATQYLTCTLDQVVGERNKLRADLDDANTHAAHLAQEVDERQARMEKQAQNKIRSIETSYQEQLRQCQETLKSEQEGAQLNVSKLKERWEAESKVANQEEARLKMEVASVQEDYNRMERENRELQDKLAENMKLMLHQQKELEELSDLRHKEEAGSEQQLNLHYKAILTELQSYKSENQLLKDKNDELVAEVEGLRTQVNSLQVNFNSKPQRAACWLADYNRTRRRTATSSTTSPDDNSEEDSPRVSRLRRKLVHTSSLEGSGTEGTE